VCFLCKNLQVPIKKSNFAPNYALTNMKNKISYIITFIFLSIGFAYTQAEPLYQTAQPESQPMQSAQVMPTTGYSGTVYAPFDASAPSEQSGVEGNSGSRHKGGIKREGNFNYGTEYGQSDQSPIGEPWVLAIFALAFAGVVALRKTKKA
jgi:hypothetical protein